MAETVIRINKRTLERTVFILIIIALAALLVWKWNGAGTMGADPAELEELQQENANLQSQLSDTQANLADVEWELEIYKNASETSDDSSQPDTQTTPDPEPEGDGLSGEVVYSWNVDADSDGRVNSVTIIVENGIDRVRTTDFKVFWDNYFEDTIYYSDDITARSGETEFTSFDPSEEGFKPTPPPDTNTLIVEFYDADGDVVDRLEEDV